MSVAVATGAGQIVDAVAVLLIICTLLMFVAQRLTENIVLLGMQSALLSVVAFTVAISTGTLHILIAAVLTVVVKVVAIPIFLFVILRRIKVARLVAPIIPRRLSVVLAIGLVLLAYWQVSAISVQTAIRSAHALPAGLCLVLLGLMQMMTRHKALAQVLGLMTMENGMYLVAMSITYGMPIVVELGIFFDVLVAAVLLGVFTYRINRTFDTISVEALRELRG